MALVVAATWLGLLVAGSPGHAGHAGHADHVAHAAHGTGGSEPGAAAGTPAWPGVGELPAWAAMVVAMMVPVTLPAVGYVARNSLRRRQRRAMALYLVPFVAVWLPFGAAALVADRLLVARLGLDRAVLLAAAVVVAGAWQRSRAKRRAVLACGRPVPLPPTGWRHDRACLRFGLQQGGRCLRSCWALMLVAVAAGTHSLPAMAALTAVVVAEERTLAGRRLLLRPG